MLLDCGRPKSRTLPFWSNSTGSTWARPTTYIVSGRQLVMADDDDQISNDSVQPPNSQPSVSGTSSESPASTSSDTRSHKTSTTQSAVVNTTPPVSQLENREELIERARLFLTSPQIRHEDLFAKRRFLAEKGLSDAEIAGLLQELVYILDKRLNLLLMCS